MSDWQREPQQHNLPSIFIKMKMVIFVFIVVVTAGACFVVTWDGVSWLSALLVQQVLRMWRMAQVSLGCNLLLFFASSPSRVLLLFSTFPSWEIQGMNMPNLPEVSCLEDIQVLGCVCCTCIAAINASCDKDCCCRMSILWYSQCPHGAFVAFIGKAALWFWGQSSRLSLSRWMNAHCISPLALHNDGIDCIHHDWWWLWTLIKPIAIGNGVIAWFAYHDCA